MHSHWYVFLILDQLSEAKLSEYSVKYELLIISAYLLFNWNRISTKWCPRKLEPFWMCNVLEKHCIYSLKGKMKKKLKQTFQCQFQNRSPWVLAMKSSKIMETVVLPLFFLTTRASDKIPAEGTTGFWIENTQKISNWNIPCGLCLLSQSM